MDPELYQRACDIFAQACNTPAAERQALVDEASSGNPELRQLVLDLLANDRSVSSRGPFDAFKVDLNEPRPGDHIRNYVIERRLGEGGMGLVYLAEQVEPVRRKVALKVVRAGMDTKVLLARFARERQLLALMDHPGIARVFDAGATESGRPYFAMEYVDGIPITAWCDQHRVGIRERLTLFIRVCQAIQSAHQKGVIHRDIKPSNILVAELDGEAAPKVIDFGIGKALEDTDSGETLHTRPGVMLGTPEYLSPEQARGVDSPDTRTDVYSLGVVLYELLVGRRPFERPRTGGNTLETLKRAIIETDPKRPSTRVREFGPEAVTRAASRNTEPLRLQRALRTDLDWIVMRALEKKRDRRYQSASQMVDDIQRHLAGKVVHARPPATIYTVRKFARRHRRSFIATASVLAALVLGGTISRIASRVIKPRPVTNVARVSTSNPSALHHYTLGVAAVQEKDFDSVRSQFRDAVGYDSTFAMAYYQWSRAESFWGMSLEVQELARNADRFRQSETTLNQFLIHSWFLFTDGQLAQLDSVLVTAPASVRSDTEFLMHLARLYWFDMRTPERALPLFQELSRIAPRYAEAYNSLAYCQVALGHYEEALDAARRYLALAPDGPNAYDTMGDIIGHVHPDSSEYYWREAVRRKSDFVVSIEKLGYLALWNGDFESARTWFESLITRSDPAEYFYRSRGIRTLALTSMCQGRFDEALSLLQQGLKTEDAVSGLFKTERAMMHTLKALILEDLGRYTEALIDADLALASADPYYHLQMPECLPTKVRLLVKLGRLDEASEAILNASHADHWRNATLVASAALERAEGSYAEAIEDLESVCATLPEASSPRLELADCYLDAGMDDRAAAACAEAFRRGMNGLRSNPIALLHGALRCAELSSDVTSEASPCTISLRFSDYWSARDELLGRTDSDRLRALCRPANEDSPFE